jgi:uncharacterized membrane protein
MELLAVLLVIALIGSWVLGVVGFFRALSAHAEIAMLRRTVEALGAGRTAASAQPRPASVPEVAPPPVPEQPEPGPEALATISEPVGSAPPEARPDIEALLTGRWGVWLGAAALVLAGVFLVRYAVD